MERRTVTRRHLIVALGMLLGLAVGTAACSPAPSPVYVQPIRASAIVTPTATPTLSGLDAEQGWHAVLQAGNVGEGNVIAGGSFVATSLYAIGLVCAGNGKVEVDVSPQGSAVFQCAASGQHDLDQMGTSQHPPAHDTIHVMVKADNDVVWRVLVEVRD